MIEIIAREPDVDTGFVANIDGAITVRAFCDRYSIGRTAFYEEINSGRLIAKKRGGKILIPLTNARAWLETLPNLESRAIAANRPPLDSRSAKVTA
jgi:hypothetical protein